MRFGIASRIFKRAREDMQPNADQRRGHSLMCGTCIFRRRVFAGTPELATADVYTLVEALRESRWFGGLRFFSA